MARPRSFLRDSVDSGNRRRVGGDKMAKEHKRNDVSFSVSSHVFSLSHFLHVSTRDGNYESGDG